MTRAMIDRPPLPPPSFYMLLNTSITFGGILPLNPNTTALANSTQAGIAACFAAPPLSAFLAVTDIVQVVATDFPVGVVLALGGLTASTWSSATSQALAAGLAQHVGMLSLNGSSVSMALVVGSSGGNAAAGARDHQPIRGPRGRAAHQRFVGEHPRSWRG